MTPNYKPKQTYPVTHDIYITNKIPKQSSSGTPYYMIESSAGTLVCWDERIANDLEISDTKCYGLALKDPKPGFKYRTIAYISGSSEKVRPTAAPKAEPIKTTAPVAAPTPVRQYTSSVIQDKSHVFEEKDLRISKLSVLSTVTNMMAAKLQSDPEYAKRDMQTLVLEAVEYANILTREFIYGVSKPGLPLPASTTPSPQIEEQPYAAQEEVKTYTLNTQDTQQVTTTYTPPPPQQAATSTVTPSRPPITATPAPTTTVQAAAPTQAPAGHNGPAAPTAAAVATPGPQQKAEAQRLFGANQDLEARMAERLRQLTQKAK